MNKKSLPLFIGVITAIVVILVINKFTVVDNCLDNGGHFDYQIAQCLLANGHVHIANFTPYLLACYFVFAIAIAYGVAKLIRKFITNE